MKLTKIYTDQSILPVTIIIGLILITLGIIICVGSQPIYIGLIIIMIGITVLTKRSGIEIDKKNNYIRVFNSFFGRIRGKKLNLSTYKIITIKKSRKGRRIYGGRTDRSVKLIGYYYDLFISSENFRNKVLIISTKELEKAQELANDWSTKLGLHVVKYAPKPSKKSLSRR